MLRRTGSWWVLPLACAACGIDAVGRLSPSDSVIPNVVDSGGASSGGDGAHVSDDGSAVPVLPSLCDPSAPALVACFRFEGEARDESGKSSNPTFAANLTFVPAREGLGVRLSLEPKSDLRLPHVNMNTPRATIEMWLRPETLPPAGSRAMLVDMNGRFGVFLKDDGSLHCRMVSSLTKITAGAWTHLACVQDGATLTTYVNGKPEAASSSTLANTSDFVGVGQNSPDGSEGFDGVLDNLRIWSEPLDPAAVAEAASR